MPVIWVLAISANALLLEGGGGAWSPAINGFPLGMLRFLFYSRFVGKGNGLWGILKNCLLILGWRVISTHRYC